MEKIFKHPGIGDRFRRIAWVGVMLVGAIAAACSWNGPYTVAVSVEPMVAHCRNLGTVVAVADMGAAPFHPKYLYSAQDSVLRTAEMMAATHVVWVNDFYFAAALAAYHCQD